MTGDLGGAAFVVDAALHATVDAANGEHIGLVEMGDGLVVLALPVLDDEGVRRVVRVHRQSASRTGPTWIADEPLEAMLTHAGLTEKRIAEVDDVRLVGFVASRGHTGRLRRTPKSAGDRTKLPLWLWGTHERPEEVRRFLNRLLDVARSELRVAS
jgi:hypothetical protein